MGERQWGLTETYLWKGREVKEEDIAVHNDWVNGRNCRPPQADSLVSVVSHWGTGGALFDGGGVNSPIQGLWASSILAEGWPEFIGCTERGYLSREL